MLKFLFKGLIRDRSRSLLPIIVVAIGVMLTVVFDAYITGVIGNSIENTAHFTTGHVKVVTRAYNDNMSQMPNDLALMKIDVLQKELQSKYPDIEWTPRIQFGGLLDAPDESGETKSQANVVGLGIDMFSSSREIDRMNLRPNLVQGKFPVIENEILLSDETFRKMKLALGDTVTLISTTMYGEMSMHNYTVIGTLNFGIPVLDRGTVIADIADVQTALNMENSAGEILGFYKNKFYNDKQAKTTSSRFNETANKEDQFAPIMLPLSAQNGMGYIVSYSNFFKTLLMIIFISVMSLILWNAELISGLRRYGEYGLRLAIGESKNEVYKSMIGEAILKGIMGTIVGLMVGLIIAWLMQEYGFDFGYMMKNSSVMVPNVIRAKITPTTFIVGFIPGITSTVIGAMLSGIGIYKRQTANLFKELQN